MTPAPGPDPGTCLAPGTSAGPGTYLVGIDSGSQSSKVVIYDLSGREICSGRAFLAPMYTPAPGVVEHPDDDLWRALTEATRAAMAAFPHDPATIAGVGLCTIRFCRALLRADGSLAAPVLSWMDKRLARPYRAADHAGRPDAAYVTTSSGYLTHRLTGRFRDSAANHAGQWPFDPVRWNWLQGNEFDASPAAAGLRRDMLFDLVAPGAVLGTITPDAAAATGLPAGLPVVATANDKAVEALGCGLIPLAPRVDGAAAARRPLSLNDSHRTGDGAGPVLLSLGTYVAAMTHVADLPDTLEHGWVNCSAVPGEYLVESHGVRRGMWTVSWLRDLLGDVLTTRAAASGRTVEQVLDDAAATVPPGSDGLLTVPDWLAPNDFPYRKGVMLGFDARHGWPHLYRSVLEGIALTMAGNIAALTTELGLAPAEVIVGGGGSASPVMMQILADVLDLPTRRAGPGSGAALGAAICAAAGVGAYPDIPTAAAAMTRLGERFTPEAGVVELYRQLRAVHADVHAHTDPLLARTHPIVDREVSR